MYLQVQAWVEMLMTENRPVFVERTLKMHMSQGHRIKNPSSPEPQVFEHRQLPGAGTKPLHRAGKRVSLNHQPMVSTASQD